MEFKLRKIGGSSFQPYTIIEMIVSNFDGSTIIEDVTNLKSQVSPDLISDLRNIADELEEQNRLISEKYNLTNQ